MNAKRLLAAMLAMALALCLCACGANGPEETEPQTTPSTTPVETLIYTPPVEDGKVTYTVTVVDENGNPVSGAMVQLCKDTCLPGMTGSDGVVEYTVAQDSYKVSFLSMPAGYTYSGDAQEFYFADGETALAITLKAAE